MERAIEGLGAQIRFALADDVVTDRLEGPFDSVEVAAMGGSALAWDVLHETLGERLSVPLRVHRDYEVGDVSANALGIACSISGNTEETLAGYEALRSRCRYVVAITAGGELQRRASDESVALIRVPIERESPGFQPRNSVGYVLAYAARIADAADLSSGLTAVVEEAEADHSRRTVRADAEEIARWIDGGVPVIYSSASRQCSLARTMKIKINENAKYPAFSGALPEINHNEMIGFESDVAPFRILYLAHPGDSPKIRKRFETMKSLFEERRMSHVQSRCYQLGGETTLGSVLAGITFGDWCSYELAVQRGVDPTPVQLIEQFKVKLAE